MEFSGEFDIGAPQEKVHSFLSDGKRMASILPDVEGFEQEGEKDFRAIARIGISFIKGRFSIKMSIVEDTPSKVSFRGSGTGAGSSATFFGTTELLPSDGATKVRWSCTVDVGGVAASMGSRMLRPSVEKYLTNLIEAFKKGVMEG